MTRDSDGERLYSKEEEVIDAILAMTEYPIDVTGDACRGDEIAFARAVFFGSLWHPRFAGYEVVEATILRDSYGAKKQQHTFTLLLKDGRVVQRKARNVYRVITMAKPRDPAECEEALREKHARGDAARAARDARLDGKDGPWGFRL